MTALLRSPVAAHRSDVMMSHPANPRYRIHRVRGGVVAVDLPAGGPGYQGDSLAVDVELDAMVVHGDGDGDDLAVVDHADVDSLGGDHDLAALGYSLLHRDWPGWRRLDADSAACSPEPVPSSAA